MYNKNAIDMYSFVFSSRAVFFPLGFRTDGVFNEAYAFVVIA